MNFDLTYNSIKTMNLCRINNREFIVKKRSRIFYKKSVTSVS